MITEIGRERFRWLDFDIENRPIAYLGSDFTTAEVTAIAAGWSDEKKIHCWVLGEDEYIDMLDEFRQLYEAAGGVTGHYIRRHDLPILNGAMLEAGLPPLPEKLTSDTKLDLTKRSQLSASQENLSHMWRTHAEPVDFAIKVETHNHPTAIAPCGYPRCGSSCPGW